MQELFYDFVPQSAEWCHDCVSADLAQPPQPFCFSRSRGVGAWLGQTMPRDPPFLTGPAERRASGPVSMLKAGQTARGALNRNNSPRATSNCRSRTDVTEEKTNITNWRALIIPIR